MNDDAETPVAQPEVVALSGQQRMILMRRPDGDSVHFVNAKGAVTLSVTLTAHGPVLRFEGASLTLETAGKLAIDAEQIHLHGCDGVVVSTAGDLELRAAGDLRSEARIQHLTATRGDVNVSNGIQLDSEGRITKIHPKFFNSAFPEMILSQAEVGTVVRIDGVLSDGPFWFRIPDAAPRIRLTFGDRVAEFPLRIDQKRRRR